MSYKFSHYNYHILDEKKFTIYNTRTGALLKGNNEEIDILDLFHNLDNYLEHEFFDILLENGVIIEDGVDELEELKKLNLPNEESKRIHLTITPTVACNFICSYCFVNTSPPSGQAFMSTDILDGILIYIEKTCQEQDIEICEIGWFGGEPLLALDLIEYFMIRLGQLSYQYDFGIQSVLVTNGYLLDKEKFEQLFELGVRKIQVTVDGSEENHNQYRITSDQKGTYQRIYQNLLSIHNGISYSGFAISIRANFFEGNLESMKELMDQYQVDFGADQRFSLSFRPILDLNDKTQNVFLLKKDARSAESCLYKRLIKGQYNSGSKDPMFDLLPGPRKRWCRVGSKNDFVICPDGSLFYCDSCISDKSKCIGSISVCGEVKLKEEYKHWLWSVFDTKGSGCLKCKRLPLCMGGCMKERLESDTFICHWTDEYILDSLKYINRQA